MRPSVGTLGDLEQLVDGARLVAPVEADEPRFSSERSAFCSAVA